MGAEPRPTNGIPSGQLLRFGIFEVDLRASELRKGGVKIKLHGQPFAVLAMLLQRPGEVVTREELQRKLWVSDTYVDFEHGLNKTINKLREALGDNADNPRYIETLPRRGYRFVGAVSQAPSVPVAGTGEEQEKTPPLKIITRKRWAIGIGLAVACALAAVGLNQIKYWTRPPRMLSYRQLTTGLQLRGETWCGLVQSGLATDGLRVFFSEPGSPVSQVSATGGEVVKISTPFPCFAFSDISPDKGSLLGLSQSNWTVADQPLWALSVTSGEARRLGDLTGHAAAWSPDGERIAYAIGQDENSPNELYVAEKDGSNPRRLIRFEKGFIESIRWSPDANVLRMVVSHGGRSLWEISVDGTNAHRIDLFPGETREVLDQSWTPDGRYSVLTVSRRHYATFWRCSPGSTPICLSIPIKS